ncbi:uncharacterized protein BcabD6B2_15770 [Babesia caballi]|uniref:Uncharacterized protein n=1 Tax=Babesia caballi TaxID=5871 RepID=A0AAV4LRA8_BABCB|nr:hypothetical protein, conserved [Babesia caballi]
MDGFGFKSTVAQTVGLQLRVLAPKHARPATGLGAPPLAVQLTRHVDLDGARNLRNSLAHLVDGLHNGPRQTLAQAANEPAHAALLRALDGLGHDVGEGHEALADALAGGDDAVPHVAGRLVHAVALPLVDVLVVEGELGEQAANAGADAVHSLRGELDGVAADVDGDLGDVEQRAVAEQRADATQSGVHVLVLHLLVEGAHGAPGVAKVLLLELQGRAHQLEVPRQADDAQAHAHQVAQHVQLLEVEAAPEDKVVQRDEDLLEAEVLAAGEGTVHVHLQEVALGLLARGLAAVDQNRGAGVLVQVALLGLVVDLDVADAQLEALVVAVAEADEGDGGHLEEEELLVKVVRDQTQANLGEVDLHLQAAGHGLRHEVVLRLVAVDDALRVPQQLGVQLQRSPAVALAVLRRGLARVRAAGGRQGRGPLLAAGAAALLGDAPRNFQVGAGGLHVNDDVVAAVLGGNEHSVAVAVLGRGDLDLAVAEGGRADVDHEGLDRRHGVLVQPEHDLAEAGLVQEGLLPPKVHGLAVLGREVDAVALGGRVAALVEGAHHGGLDVGALVAQHVALVALLRVPAEVVGEHEARNGGGDSAGDVVRQPADGDFFRHEADGVHLAAVLQHRVGVPADGGQADGAVNFFGDPAVDAEVQGVVLVLGGEEGEPAHDRARQALPERDAETGAVDEPPRRVYDQAQVALEGGRGDREAARVPDELQLDGRHVLDGDLNHGVGLGGAVYLGHALRPLVGAVVADLGHEAQRLVGRQRVNVRYRLTQQRQRLLNVPVRLLGVGAALVAREAVVGAEADVKLHRQSVHHAEGRVDDDVAHLHVGGERAAALHDGDHEVEEVGLGEAGAVALAHAGALVARAVDDLGPAGGVGELHPGLGAGTVLAAGHDAEGLDEVAVHGEGRRQEAHDGVGGALEGALGHGREVVVLEQHRVTGVLLLEAQIVDAGLRKVHGSGLAEVVARRVAVVQERYRRPAGLEAGDVHDVHLLVEEAQEQRHPAAVVHAHRGGEHEELVRRVGGLDLADERVAAVGAGEVLDRGLERDAAVPRERDHGGAGAVFEGRGVARGQVGLAVHQVLARLGEQASHHQIAGHGLAVGNAQLRADLGHLGRRGARDDVDARAAAVVGAHEAHHRIELVGHARPLHYPQAADAAGGAPGGLQRKHLELVPRQVHAAIGAVLDRRAGLLLGGVQVDQAALDVVRQHRNEPEQQLAEAGGDVDQNGVATGDFEHLVRHKVLPLVLAARPHRLAAPAAAAAPVQGDVVRVLQADVAPLQAGLPVADHGVEVVQPRGAADDGVALLDGEAHVLDVLAGDGEAHHGHEALAHVVEEGDLYALEVEADGDEPARSPRAVRARLGRGAGRRGRGAVGEHGGEGGQNYAEVLGVEGEVGGRGGEVEVHLEALVHADVLARAVDLEAAAQLLALADDGVHALQLAAQHVYLQKVEGAVVHGHLEHKVRAELELRRGRGVHAREGDELAVGGLEVERVRLLAGAGLLRVRLLGGEGHGAAAVREGEVAEEVHGVDAKQRDVVVGHHAVEGRLVVLVYHHQLDAVEVGRRGAAEKVVAGEGLVLTQPVLQQPAHLGLQHADLVVPAGHDVGVRGALVHEAVEQAPVHVGRVRALVVDGQHLAAEAELVARGHAHVVGGVVEADCDAVEAQIGERLAGSEERVELEPLQREADAAPALGLGRGGDAAVGAALVGGPADVLVEHVDEEGELHSGQLEHPGRGVDAEVQHAAADVADGEVRRLQHPAHDVGRAVGLLNDGRAGAEHLEVDGRLAGHVLALCVAVAEVEVAELQHEVGAQVPGVDDAAQPLGHLRAKVVAGLHRLAEKGRVGAGDVTGERRPGGVGLVACVGEDCLVLGEEEAGRRDGEAVEHVRGGGGLDDLVVGAGDEDAQNAVVQVVHQPCDVLVEVDEHDAFQSSANAHGIGHAQVHAVVALPTGSHQRLVSGARTRRSPPIGHLNPLLQRGGVGVGEQAAVAVGQLACAHFEAGDGLVVVVLHHLVRDPAHAEAGLHLALGVPEDDSRPFYVNGDESLVLFALLLGEKSGQLLEVNVAPLHFAPDGALASVLESVGADHARYAPVYPGQQLRCGDGCSFVGARLAARSVVGDQARFHRLLQRVLKLVVVLVADGRRGAAGGGGVEVREEKRHVQGGVRHHDALEAQDGADAVTGELELQGDVVHLQLEDLAALGVGDGEAGVAEHDHGLDVEGELFQRGFRRRGHGGGLDVAPAAQRGARAHQAGDDFRGDVVENRGVHGRGLHEKLLEEDVEVQALGDEVAVVVDLDGKRAQEAVPRALGATGVQAAQLGLLQLDGAGQVGELAGAVGLEVQGAEAQVYAVALVVVEHQDRRGELDVEGEERRQVFGGHAGGVALRGPELVVDGGVHAEGVQHGPGCFALVDHAGRDTEGGAAGAVRLDVNEHLEQLRYHRRDEVGLHRLELASDNQQIALASHVVGHAQVYGEDVGGVAWCQLGSVDGVKGVDGVVGLEEGHDAAVAVADIEGVQAHVEVGVVGVAVARVNGRIQVDLELQVASRDGKRVGGPAGEAADVDHELEVRKHALEVVVAGGHGVFKNLVHLHGVLYQLHLLSREHEAAGEEFRLVSFDDRGVPDIIGLRHVGWALYRR